MKIDKVRIGPVTVEDFHSMAIDWSGHLDHGISAYWDLMLGIAATVGLFVDDQCIFILGGIADGTGILTLFVLSSTHMRHSWAQRLIVRYSKVGLGILQRLYKPHRIQSIVNPLNDAHVAFIKHYGFVYEGTLKHFTPSGLDADIYGRRGFE